ncbi:MAG: hypothetical protein ABMB14_30995, partial [Myxococcota bacterium]
RAAGGEGTGASCHLPGGDHTVRGTADRAWLRASVAIDVARDGAGARFTVRSVGVGHALPSGDLFRRLTLDVDRGEGFVTAATFGRSFALDGEVKVQRADTSLQPGEPRQVTVDAVPPGARWRLRWHDGAVHDEQRGWVDPETIVADLATGAL